MFAHATSAYPDRYFWYQQSNGHYVCSSQPPARGTSYTQCNRVERLPFFDYLINYQYGSYVYMNNPSIVGVHIEKLSNFILFS